MESLIEQFGIDSIAPLIVLEVVDQISAGLHGYDDNGPVRIAIRPNPSPDRDDQGKRVIPDDRATLNALAQNKIIIYRFNSTRLMTDSSRTSQIYDVYVTDRFRFEQLLVELDQRYSNRFTRLGQSPHVDNLIYYNPSTGDVSANGVRGKLKQRTKYKNRAVFGLILRHSPKPVPREEVLKTLQLTSKTKFSDEDRTYGINHAIDNLRDALGVKSGVISLKTDGVHLNATCVLVEQLPEDFRFTD